MQIDTWPRLVCERFDDESSSDYKQRSARIAEIMTGFRMGRYPRDIADVIERELVALQEQGLTRLAG